MAQRLQVLLRRRNPSVSCWTDLTTNDALLRILSPRQQARRTWSSLVVVTNNNNDNNDNNNISIQKKKQQWYTIVPCKIGEMGFGNVDHLHNNNRQITRRLIHTTIVVSDKKADKKAAAEARKAAKKAAKEAASAEEEDKEESSTENEKKPNDDKDEATEEKKKRANHDEEEETEDESQKEYANPRHFETRDFEKIFPEDFDGEEMPPPTPIPPFALHKDDIPASQKLKDLTEEIVYLNMLEMNELVQKLSHHFGFDDEPMMPMGGGGGGAGGGDGGGEEKEAAEKKTAFDVKLVGFDAKAKIKVIKEVRSIAELGLKEAKELVEKAPTAIKKDVSEDTANELKAKIEAVGGQVEIE